MSSEKVLFAFIIVLALTLNAGFVYGDPSDIAHHNRYELFAALVVSLVATVMKFGDRTALGSSMLATSLVSDLQLLAAAICWGWLADPSGALSSAASTTVVSLAFGGLIANVVSVILLLVEVASFRR